MSACECLQCWVRACCLPGICDQVVHQRVSSPQRPRDGDKPQHSSRSSSWLVPHPKNREITRVKPSAGGVSERWRLEEEKAPRKENGTSCEWRLSLIVNYWNGGEWQILSKLVGLADCLKLYGINDRWIQKYRLTPIKVMGGTMLSKEFHTRP